MKILPLYEGIKNDITSSGVRLCKATADGYCVADRTARIYKQSVFKKYLSITKSIGGKVIKGTTKNELPYLAGAIGLMLPVPLMCPIMLGLGFLAKFSASGAGIIYDKMSRMHYIDITG